MPKKKGSPKTAAELFKTTIMIKNLLKYPITYLILILIVYTVYDYFEHIGRTGSTFKEHPWYWLLFSASAIVSFIFIVIFVKQMMQKLFNKKSLIIEVTAIAIWLLLYLSVLGPLIDQVFWPFDDLHFRFRFGPFIIILFAYFIIRLLINLVIGKKALYSK